MLKNALRVMVNNPFKESFYGKKKAINVLTTFSISHKCLAYVQYFFKRNLILF